VRTDAYFVLPAGFPLAPPRLRPPLDARPFPVTAEDGMVNQLRATPGGLVLNHLAPAQRVILACQDISLPRPEKAG
jgi:hypothetical protein